MHDHLRCTVLVIGAGPAGASAAYVLARAGVDVILADRVYFPRDKPCGDGLTPYCVAVLQDMGVAEFLVEQGRPYNGVRVHKPDRSIGCISLQPDRSGDIACGYVLPRVHLDSALVDLACKAGAKFLPRFNPLCLDQEIDPQNGAASLRVTAMWQGHTVTVVEKLVIIATGANRRLLQKLGLAVKSQPTALAMRAYIGSLGNLEARLEIFLDGELLPGYGWIYPVGDECANVGVGVQLLGRELGKGIRLMKDAFRRLLQHERLAGGVMISQVQGYPIFADYPLVPLSFPGVLVVGEAAGLVDPITGEGISPALVSGHLAALTAMDAIRSGNFHVIQLREYDEWIKIKYGGYFSESQSLLRWLASGETLSRLVECAREDARVTAAIDLAIRARRPAVAHDMLIELIGDSSRIGT